MIQRFIFITLKSVKCSFQWNVNIPNISQHNNKPLFDGTTSGFLSSFSKRSSESDRKGNVTLSLTARKRGLKALEPSLLDWRILRAPKIMTVMSNKAVTMPTKIPSTGAISIWSRVPRESTENDKGYIIKTYLNVFIRLKIIVVV